MIRQNKFISTDKESKMKTIVSFFGEKTEIFEQLNRQAEEYAGKAGFAYKWMPLSPFSPEEVVRHLSVADIGIIDIEPYGETIFSRISHSCKLLIRFGVGYDKVDLPSASRHGIAVARTTGANTLGVAEMAFSLIMAARRKLKYFDHTVARENWKKVIVHETIQSTVGIVGFGAIGRALTKLFQGWNCDIITYDPNPDKKKMEELGVRLVSLEELFKTADTISLHLPYTPDTHHLIGEKLLYAMKPGAVIVNTSRGNIIAEDILAQVIREGRICGAGMDVFAEEPLPADSPLMGQDNLMLTPHISSQTIESLWRIYRMAIDIAADFEAGKDSPHILNPEYKTGSIKAYENNSA
jgi:phosphoglycerate dehydrogenase-like enzyme